MNITHTRALSLITLVKRWVSNVSPKRFHYTFETGTAHKLSDGTDRILISPNLLAITDHGSGVHNKKYSQNLDDTYTKKLLKVINSFFYHELGKYMDNPTELVSSSVNSFKLQGNCTLTLAMLHPETGEVVFYYIGDSLYAIFKEKHVVVVEPLYYGFNQSYRLGTDSQTPQSGFVERYPYQQIKDQVIAIGSNGLWSNVDLQLLHYEIRGPHSFNSRQKQPNSKHVSFSDAKPLQQISERVASMASYYSKKGNYESPFFKMAQRYGVQVPKQGYLDDASVILARVKREVVIK